MIMFNVLAGENFQNHSQLRQNQKLQHEIVYLPLESLARNSCLQLKDRRR